MPVAAFTPTGPLYFLPPSFSSSLLNSRRPAQLRCFPSAPLRASTTPNTPAAASSRASLSAVGVTTVAETLQPLPCTVLGEIPAWLRGTLTRVGPAVFEVPARDGSVLRFRHWADALPFVHRFEIHGARDVTYDSRHVARHIERAVAEAPTAEDYGALLVGGRRGNQTLLKRLKRLATMARGQSSESKEGLRGVTPYPVGVVIERGTVGRDPFVLTTDAPPLMRLDPETMAPLEILDYSDLGVQAGQMALAHGQYDAEEDAFYNLVYSPATKGCDVSIIRVEGKTFAASVLATLKNVPTCYVHSFAMTDKYVIMCVPSSRVDGLAVLSNLSFTDGVSFDAEAAMLFLVVDRESGEHISTFTAPPGFFFHIPNCYDEISASGGSNVVIDICIYDSATGISSFADLTVERLSDGCDGTLATLKAFTLTDVDRCTSGEAEEVALSSLELELPRINEAYARKPHWYVYGVSGENGKLFSSLRKVDRMSRSSILFESPEDGVFYSEPIFVADPTYPNDNEGSGVLLSVELDARESSPTSALIILDAGSMKEVARCVVHTTIPFSFHGDFQLKP